MKKSIKIISLILFLTIILLLVFLLLTHNKIEKLQNLNWYLSKNIENNIPKEEITISLDRTTDGIPRIGVYSSMHYEITNTNDIDSLLSLINNLTLKRTNKSNSDNNYLYNITVYSIFNRELLNIKILSEAKVVIQNYEYEIVNNNIDIEKIKELIPIV